MKKVIFLLLIFTLVLLACLPVLGMRIATPIAIEDMLGILSEEDLSSLTYLPDINTNGIEFYLITISSEFADDRLSDNAVFATCGFSSSTPDAVVLVVRKTRTTQKFFYDMYTYGAANEAFRDSDIDRVLDDDDVYDNLKAGRVGPGAKAFFTLCAEHIEERNNKLAARERRAPLVTVLVALGVGLAAAGLSVLGVVLSYRRKLHGITYPLDRYAKLNLTQREDRFIGSFVTRVKIKTSNGSGGSHSGGGGFRGGR